MNIEQLNQGQKLQKELEVLYRKQKKLIESFKNRGENSGHLYVGFGSGGETYVVTPQTVQKIFDIINNDLMRQILDKENEFSNL